MAGFYQVYLRPTKYPLLFNNRKVEKILDLAFDWYRIDPTLYVIYTKGDAKIWYSRLRKHLGQGGNLFVCRLDPTDRQGWMSKRFWEWVKKNQTREHAG